MATLHPEENGERSVYDELDIFGGMSPCDPQPPPALVPSSPQMPDSGGTAVEAQLLNLHGHDLSRMGSGVDLEQINNGSIEHIDYYQSETMPTGNSSSLSAEYGSSTYAHSASRNRSFEVTSTAATKFIEDSDRIEEEGPYGGDTFGPEAAEEAARDFEAQLSLERLKLHMSVNTAASEEKRSSLSGSRKWSTSTTSVNVEVLSDVMPRSPLEGLQNLPPELQDARLAQSHREYYRVLFGFIPVGSKKPSPATEARPRFLSDRASTFSGSASTSNEAQVSRPRVTSDRTGMSGLRSPSPVKETNVMVRDFDTRTGYKMLNQYVLLRELGRGVHGKVKLAYDTENDEFVAVKIVRKQNNRPRNRLSGLGMAVASPDLKIRKEIAIMKKCIHPHVVRLYEVIDDPKSQKIFMGEF